MKQRSQLAPRRPPGWTYIRIYIYIYIYPEVPTVPLNRTGPIFVFRFPFVEFRVPLFTPLIVVLFVVVGVIDMLFTCTCVLSHATPMPNHIGANMMFELSCCVL